MLAGRFLSHNKRLCCHVGGSHAPWVCFTFGIFFLLFHALFYRLIPRIKVRWPCHISTCRGGHLSSSFCQHEEILEQAVLSFSLVISLMVLPLYIFIQDEASEKLEGLSFLTTPTLAPDSVLRNHTFSKQAGQCATRSNRACFQFQSVLFLIVVGFTMYVRCIHVAQRITHACVCTQVHTYTIHKLTHTEMKYTRTYTYKHSNIGR